MNNMYENIKSVLMVILAGIISVFSPIVNALYILFFVFCFNFILGIAGGININDERFNLKKAFDSIVQITFFVFLILMVHQLGGQFGDRNVSLLGVKWITYIVVYFYTTNILKNAKLLFPRNPAIDFLHIVLTTRVFKSIKRMVGINSKK